MAYSTTSDFSPEFWRAWSAVQTSPVSSGLGSGTSTGTNTSTSAGLGTGLSNSAGAGTGNNGLFENVSNYGSWLQGFGSILDGFAGYKNYRLGKDQLAFNKEAFAFNKDLQIASALAQAQGRLSEMQAYGAPQDLSYLHNLINTLQSYGQNNQNLTFTDTQRVEGAMDQLDRFEAAQDNPALASSSADWGQSGVQQPQQQNAQNLLTQPTALSWGNNPMPNDSTPRDTAIRPDDLRFARR